MKKIIKTANYVYTSTGTMRPIFKVQGEIMFISIECLNKKNTAEFYIEECYMSVSDIKNGKSTFAFQQEVKEGFQYLSDATAIRLVIEDKDMSCGCVTVHVSWAEDME